MLLINCPFCNSCDSSNRCNNWYLFHILFFLNANGGSLHVTHLINVISHVFIELGIPERRARFLIGKYDGKLWKKSRCLMKGNIRELHISPEGTSFLKSSAKKIIESSRTLGFNVLLDEVSHLAKYIFQAIDEYPQRVTVMDLNDPYFMNHPNIPVSYDVIFMNIIRKYIYFANHLLILVKTNLNLSMIYVIDIVMDNIDYFMESLGSSNVKETNPRNGLSHVKNVCPEEFQESIRSLNEFGFRISLPDG